MIQRRTAFILGAGASNPYGFPTGAELYKLVCHSTDTPPLDQADEFYESIFGDNFSRFRTALAGSGQTSVDSFLADKRRGQQFLSIGKEALALALIPCENPSNLLPSPPGKPSRSDWYRHLYTALDTEPEQFSRNAASFVTFNYDRSLEHFFATALQNSYGLSAPDACDLLKAIPIIHVYGSLGDYLDHQSRRYRRYSPDVTRRNFEICASSIQIMDEGTMDSEELQDARKHLSLAERVIFLGFGFAPLNIQRLQLDLVPKDAEIISSGFGISDKNRQLISKRIGRAVTFGGIDQSVLDFLQHDVDLTQEISAAARGS